MKTTNQGISLQSNLQKKYWQTYHLKGVKSRYVEYPTEKQHGLGMTAIEDIPKMTAFVVCPFNLVLNQSNILKQYNKKLQIPTKLLDRIDESYIYLIDWIICQKLSENDPWFNIQPKGLIYFNKTTILQTKDQYLISKYNQQIQNMQTYFDAYYQNLHQTSRIVPNIQKYQSIEKQVYRNAFQYAYMFVSNRSFGNFNKISLIPIVDCVNHSRNQEMCTMIPINIHFQNDQNVYDNWVQDMRDKFPNKLIQKYEFKKTRINMEGMLQEEQKQKQKAPGEYLVTDDRVQFPITHVILYSIRDIHIGQEIMMNYGSKNNIDLLLNYGFSELNNSQDTLIIYLDQNSIQYNKRSQRTAEVFVGKSKISLIIEARKIFNSVYLDQKHGQKQSEEQAKVDYQMWVVDRLINLLTRNPFGYSSYFNKTLDSQKSASGQKQIQYLSFYLKNKLRIFCSLIQYLKGVRQFLTLKREGKNLTLYNEKIREYIRDFNQQN